MINTASEKKKIGLIPILIVVGLLILRYPFLITVCIATKLPISPQSAVEIFDIGTYILSLLFIFVKRDDLEKYNIDITAIIMLLLIPLVAPLTNRLFIPASWDTTSLLTIRGGIALIFASTFFFCKYKFTKTPLKKTLLWCLIGIVTITILSFIHCYFVKMVMPGTSGGAKITLPIAMGLFFIQTNNAALSEEPLFRSFMFGVLREKNIKDHWIILIQASLFAFAHIYYIKQPILLLGTFVISLLLGFLASNSKTITVTILAHGLVNSLCDILLHATF